MVCCVPENTAFVPRTRKEIKDCDWFFVDQLPLHKTDRVAPKNMNPSAFFMIIPFMKKLKRWIEEHSTDKVKQLTNLRDENVESGAGGSRGGSVSPGYIFLNVDNGQGRKRHKSMSDLDGNTVDQRQASYEDKSDRSSNSNQQDQNQQGYQQPLHNYNLLNVKQGNDRKNKSMAKNLPSVNETQMLNLPVQSDYKAGRNSPNTRKHTQTAQQQKPRTSKTILGKSINPKSGLLQFQKSPAISASTVSIDDTANNLNKLFKQLLATSNQSSSCNSFFNPNYQENIFNPPQITQLIRNQPSINKWRNVRLNYDAIINESLRKN